MVEAAKILEAQIHKVYKDALKNAGNSIHTKERAGKEAGTKERSGKKAGTKFTSPGGKGDTGLNMEDLGSMEANKSKKSFRNKLEYFKNPSECAPGLSPGVLNFSPAWHAIGYEHKASIELITL